MTDSISRCELFNKLATIPAPPEANDFKAQVYMIIQSMETSEKWIPCSERLPSKDEMYLVTIEWDGKSGTHYIEIEGIDFENGRWCCHDYEKITAWMPLPKPYKERSK